MTESIRSALELAADVRNGRCSSATLVERSLARIDADELHAFITSIGDEARARAHTIDSAVSRGENPGALAGVPVAIKDLRTRKKGVRNTFGLKALADNVATEDSIGVERLEAAGAVVVGTTNTPAIAHTIKTDNRLIGATPTPFDPELSAGGSSGGSAAAVASGAVRLATGSDIGGSLRVPASCCNVIGLKPTLGVIPETGPIDSFSDQTPAFVGGPIARSARDTALLLEVLAGHDDRDPLSVPLRDDEYRSDIDRPASDLTVAYSPDLNLLPVEPAIRETVGNAVNDLSSAGVTVDPVEVSLPPYEELSMAYVKQVGAFFGAFAKQLEEVYGIDFETANVKSTVRSTIALADGVTAIDERMQNVPRTAAYKGIQEALGGHDALITPTLTVPPYGKYLSDGYPTEIDGESVLGVPTDAMLTWVCNLTGHPAASVPAGFTDDGLPIGLQVIGHRYRENDILAVAGALERARPWAGAYPDTH